MITLRFAETAEEGIAFSVSPLLEAVHSWHVLTDPGHHALHVPWVRRCRRLPAALRRRMREHGFVVADYIPAFFESRASDHEADFARQLAAVRTLPPALLAAELAQTLIDTTRHTGHDLVTDPTTRDTVLTEYRDSDPDRAARLKGILTDPLPVLDDALTVLEDYWNAAFASGSASSPPCTSRSPAQAPASPTRACSRCSAPSPRRSVSTPAGGPCGSTARTTTTSPSPTSTP